MIPDSWEIGGHRWSIVLRGDLPDPAGKTLWRDPVGSFTLHSADSGDARLIAFVAGAQFLVDPATREIAVFQDRAGLSDHTLRHLLLDQVIPRVISSYADLVLHSSSVVHDDGLLVFLGDTGHGKSTLAASLSVRGAPLLGDDALIVACTANPPSGKAVYPSLRLNPDSLGLLENVRHEVALMADYSQKQSVHLDDSEFALPGAEGLPIKGVFLIAPPSAHGNPAASPVNRKDASMALLQNSFALDPTNKADASRRMIAAARLCNAVPVFSLAYQRDYALLPQVHEAIFGAFR